MAILFDINMIQQKNMVVNAPTIPCLICNSSRHPFIPLFLRTLRMMKSHFMVKAVVYFKNDNYHNGKSRFLFYEWQLPQW